MHKRTQVQNSLEHSLCNMLLLLFLFLLLLSARLVKIFLLPDALQLLITFLGTLTYLEPNLFILIIFNNLHFLIMNGTQY
jgi:hypothetical protein